MNVKKLLFLVSLMLSCVSLSQANTSLVFSDTCAQFNFPVAPGNDCLSAPPFCADYLNGFCSVNDSMTTASPAAEAAFGCSLENTQWLSFIPCATEGFIALDVGSCLSGTALEFAVLGSDNCLDFTNQTGCLSIASGGIDTIFLSNLLPNEICYLVVDGMDGAICHWQVTYIDGASGNAYLQEDITPGTIDGECKICLGAAGPPSMPFDYSVTGPSCNLIPVDTTCSGDPLPCDPAPQQFCIPHMDTLIQPIAWDTIWHIDPPDAGYFENDDSIGQQVTIIWDSVGVFYLEAEIVGVEFDTIPFWNNCIDFCTIVCPDKEGDDCRIERKRIDVGMPDDEQFFVEKCPEECYFLQVNSSSGGAPFPTGDTLSNSGGGVIAFCAPGIYDFYAYDDAGCVDHYSLEIIDYFPQDEFYIVEEICPGECAFFQGDIYCPGSHAIPAFDFNGCMFTIFLEVIPAQDGNVVISGTPSLNCLNPSGNLSADSDYPGVLDYSWSTGDNGQSIVVTSGGVYTVSAFDLNGCLVDIASFSVQEDFNEATIDLGEIVLCPGECFEFQGTDYCDEGNYEVVTTDPNTGCDSTYLFSITIEMMANLAIGPVTELCDGINETYTVGFTITDGIPPFFVDGDPVNGNFYLSPPLPTGTNYVFTVSDNNTCSPQSSLVTGFWECPCLTEPGTMATALLSQCESDLVTPDFNNDAVLDGNDLLQFILHDASGTVAGNILGTNSTGSFGFITGVMEYGVTYYISPVAGNDNNGMVDMSHACTQVGTGQPVVFYQEPEVLYLSVPPIDCNNPTQVIEGSVVGGSGQFAVSWTGPGNFQSTDLNPVISQGGIFGCVVTDVVSGCSLEETFVVDEDLEQPIVNPSSSGMLDCNQPIAQLSSGAFDPLVSYQWLFPSGDMMSGPSVSTNLAGDYTLLAIGLNGCESQGSLTLTENFETPFLQASDGLVTCDNPVATLSGFSGEPGVVFDWELPNGEVVQDISIQTTTVGEYLLTATGLNGCTNTIDVSVAADTLPPDLLAADAEITCAFPSTTLVANSSTPGVTITWVFPTGNEVEGTEVVTNLTGNYQITAQAPNGCTADTLIEVVNNEVLPDFSVTDGIIDCEQSADSLFATSPQSGLSFEWESPSGEVLTGAAILAEEPGMYTVQATGPNGCTAEVSAQVADSTNVPDLVVSYEHLDCDQPTTTLLATSSFGSIQYNWLFPNGNAVAGNSLLASLPGMYEVVATAANGCTSTESFELLEDTDPPMIEVASENISCVNLEADLLASSTNPNVVFVWNGPGVVDFEGPLLETELAGQFELLATSSNGCSSDTSIFIIEEPGPELTMELAWQDPTCFNDEDGFILIGDVLGASTIVSASVDGEPFNFPEVSNLPAGIYALTIEDENGCQGDTLIELNNPMEVAVELGDDVYVSANQLVELDFSASIVPSTITWTGPGGEVWNGVTTLSIMPQEDGAFTIAVADANGCTATDQVQLFVEGEAQLFVPNVFSPNGDQTNDFLTVFASAAVESIASFKVFDRWGNMVYARSAFPPNDPAFGWDGQYKDKKMNDGVFAYILEAQLANGERQQVTGEVLLIQ